LRAADLVTSATSALYLLVQVKTTAGAAAAATVDATSAAAKSSMHSYCTKVAAASSR